MLLQASASFAFAITLLAKANHMNELSQMGGHAKDIDSGRGKELGPLMQSLYLACVTKLAWGRCTFSDYWIQGIK